MDEGDLCKMSPGPLAGRNKVEIADMRFLTRTLMATLCMLILVLPAMASDTPLVNATTPATGIAASPAATVTIGTFATPPNTATIDTEKLLNSWQPAPGYETPRMQMTNMGTEQLNTFQGHDLSSLTNRGGGVGSILYAPSQPDNPTFRAAVAACSGATVDYFDASAGTPDVALLAAYDCVLVWGNYAFADAFLYGDNLAAYVDGGGKVILGQWCYHTTQINWLEGAIMGMAYCPITASAYESGAYNGDGTDCVHGGVVAYESSYFDACSPIIGAASDGTFSNPSNSLAVAWRPDRAVYYSPGNTGTDYGTGDWPQLVCNMAMCGGGGGWGILYAPSTVDNPDFRAELAACTGLNVDYYDASAGTPTMSELSGYTCVLTWANSAYADNVLFGDNLAAYVDGGGKVILGQWTYDSGQLNALAGAIMTAAYCPVTTSTSYDVGAYNDDGIDCVHGGVSAYDTSYLDVATVVAGALSDGTFSNPSNSLAVAWRPDRAVYYSPGNTGGSFGTGQWAQLVCNMVFCIDVTTGDILYAPSEADNPTFRAEVEACTGLTVDYFDPRVATPDVALLSNYQCVLTWANWAYFDNVAFGDNLAAYVDLGGQVILGQWCLPTAGNYLDGAIMTPAYCPTTGMPPWETGTYNGDGTDCVFGAVTFLDAPYFDAATLVAGASDGTFNNPSNSLAVAWRADRMVYSSPGNTGGTYSTGDWAQLVCNMIECPAGPSGTIAVDLNATPDTGFAPFVTAFTTQLTNLTTERRRASARINVVIANGNNYNNWRAGWTNLDSMETFTRTWPQTIPALATVIGTNTFTLEGEDVTPAPYNQPPYAPSGDTDTDVQTVIAN